MQHVKQFYGVIPPDPLWKVEGREGKKGGVQQGEGRKEKEGRGRNGKGKSGKGEEVEGEKKEDKV